VQSGGVSVTGTSLTSSGQITLAATTTDKVTLAAGSTFSGGGALVMNGTTTVTADLTVTVAVSLHNLLTGPGTSTWRRRWRG
jgi:hypothetical protein